MKIAIHDSKRQDFFSYRWIEFCRAHNISYKLVNAYGNDIIDQVRDCDAFMWHFSNYSYKDALFAKQLLFSIQKMGLKIFPDFDTMWHFDDKVGQKYLLEAINAPLASTYIFYSEKEAINWVKSASFPLVFKLRGGSGSSNVKIIKTEKKAKKIIKKAFGKGYPQFDRWNHFRFRVKNFIAKKEGFLAIIKGVGRLFIGTEYSRMHPREKGYVYFQEFIPNDGYDIRVQIAGNKAMAMIRYVRENDFRASGGGNITRLSPYLNSEIIKLSFSIAENLGTQSCAIDLIRNNNDNKLYVTEISYGYGIDDDEFDYGYWTTDGVHHKDVAFNGIDWQIENLIKSTEDNRH